MTHDRAGRTDAATAVAMAPERFRDLLDAYGAAPHHWPEAQRAAALALLGRSPEARQAREAAARLDALLDLAPAESPSAALRARILAAAPVVAAPAMAAAVPGLARPDRSTGWAALAGRLFGAWRFPAWSPRLSGWIGAPSWRPALALAASLVLGIAVGYTAPPSFLADSADQTSVSSPSDLVFGVVDSGEQLL